MPYFNLDLSPKGEIARELSESVDEEIARFGGDAQPVDLSSHTEPYPGDLTPSMRSWYESFISGPRRRAVADVFRRLRDGGPAEQESKAVLYDFEACAAQQKYLGKLDELQGRRSTQQIAKLNHAREEEIEAERRFRKKEATHDRPPKMVNPVVYWGAISMIGVAEMAINWESFNAVSGFTPAIATGVTVVIAVALALSSHFIGTAFRHVRHDMDDSQSDYDRWAKVKMFSFGFLALALVLASVAYARENFLAAELQRAMTLGGSNAPNALRIIGGSMLSNVIVWIVGVLLAYMLHDPDPTYPAAKEALEKARAKHQKILDKIEKSEDRQRRAIEAALRNDLKDGKNTSENCSYRHNVKEAADLLERLKEKDREVIALLDRAKTRVASSVDPRRARFKRKRNIDNSALISEEITASAYAGLSLNPVYREE